MRPTAKRLLWTAGILLLLAAAAGTTGYLLLTRSITPRNMP